jgi:integrase
LQLPRQGRKVFNFTAWDNGERRLSYQVLSGRIITLARLAGVRLTMRSLCRGFGCRWAGKVPAQVLQKLMRHSDIKITMQYYANVDDVADAAIQADDYVTPGVTVAQSVAAAKPQVRDRQPLSGTV